MYKNSIRLFIFLLVTAIALQASAQTNWMIAEKISKQNRWNRPFYAPLNSVAQLELNRTDSAAYCKDCSIPSLLFDAVIENKISSYQVDKTLTLSAISIADISKKYAAYLKSILKPTTGSLSASILQAEIVLFRRPVTTEPATLKELQLEWIALELKDTSTATKKIPPFRLYMRAADCFSILNESGCQWTHPVNLNYTSDYSIAFTNRTYLVEDYSIVSVNTLKIIPEYVKKEKMPTLAYNLLVNDPNKSHGMLANENSDDNYVHLFAVCTADIRDQKNLGYYKVQLPALLLNLFQNGILKAYKYHTDGYFTELSEELLAGQLLIDTGPDNDFALKTIAPDEFYSIHILKEAIKTTSSLVLKNEWIILGTAADQSIQFNNTFAVAFKYDEVLKALGKQKTMWFNGSNQNDSVRMDEALRTQRIAYKSMSVYTIYSDTILKINSVSSYTETRYDDKLSTALYSYALPLVADYDASNKKLIRATKVKTISYNLTYYFNETANTFLTKSSACTDIILKAIKEKKLIPYEDASLQQKSSPEGVLNKLDKARFYKTGNAKKDSIYISTLSDENRYIPTNKLTEFYLYSQYRIQDEKETNQPIALGIIIPAELNPQYNTEALCYVSYRALVHYLSQSKEHKKYISQLSSLKNEKNISLVTDFYTVERYVDPGDEEYPESIDALPSFIIQHLSGKHK